MGSCNSCEQKDDTRFWRFEESPCGDEPTAIQPVSTDSRRADPGDLKASPLPAPIVNIQNAPAAPDPTGLATALHVLGTPNLFKDVTGLDQTQKNALAALQANTEAAKYYATLAANLAEQKGSSQSADKTTSAADKSASGGTQQAANSQTKSPSSTAVAQPAASGKGTSGGGVAGPSGGAAAGSATPKPADPTPPTASTVNSPQEAGFTANLGDPQDQTFTLASFVPGSSLPTPPVGRPCCIFGHPGMRNIIAIGTIGSHSYFTTFRTRPSESNGILYSCRGGFIDLGHLRDNADMTAYWAAVAKILFAAGGIGQLDTGFGQCKVSFRPPVGYSPTLETYIRLGQRIAYQLGIWHEIATWDNERYSSFSPEDCYSNLLGAYIAGYALRSQVPYDDAMNTQISSWVGLLSPLAAAVTIAAMDKVDMVWWDRTEIPNAFAGDLYLKRRNMDVLQDVTPWLVTDPAIPCAGQASPATMTVVDSDSNGTDLSQLYDLEITPATGAIRTQFLPNPTLITPADFPQIIANIRAEVIALWSDGDRPD